MVSAGRWCLPARPPLLRLSVNSSPAPSSLVRKDRIVREPGQHVKVRKPTHVVNARFPGPVLCADVWQAQKAGRWQIVFYGTMMKAMPLHMMSLNLLSTSRDSHKGKNRCTRLFYTSKNRKRRSKMYYPKAGVLPQRQLLQPSAMRSLCVGCLTSF